MLLQKMRDADGHIITCVMNTCTLGGEFTVCGQDAVDRTIGSFDHCEIEPVGCSFHGELNKCTCKDCKKIISWFKDLK
jgi:hypothetical protein